MLSVPHGWQLLTHKATMRSHACYPDEATLSSLVGLPWDPGLHQPRADRGQREPLYVVRWVVKLSHVVTAVFQTFIHGRPYFLSFSAVQGV